MTFTGTHAAVLCSADGRIASVLRSDDPVLSETTGATVQSLIDAGSLPKADAFLRDVGGGNAVLFWELNVRVPDGTGTMLFSGAREDDKLLVIATRGYGELFELATAVCSVAPTAVARLLGAAEKQSAALGERMTSGGDLLEELSRLNNELANLQRELARRNAELQRMERLKNQLLGMAAHDLRSPLGLVRTYADFLLTDPADPPGEQQRRLLETIRSSSEFMMELVNDLLDVAAIEAGGVTLAPVHVDVESIVRAHVEVQRVLSRPKGVNLALNIEAGLTAVLDPRRFEQVLYNVIGNAVKFSPAGSTVEVAAHRDGTDLVVRVTDHGVGIPPERLGQIFEPFRSSGARGTAGERGTGLGLAIVRRIVVDHGGTVAVRSEPGVGSEFELRFPLRT